MRAEDHQRQGALGDGQDAVATAVQQRKPGGRRRAEQHHAGRTDGMRDGRQACRKQRMEALQQNEFQTARTDLRRPDQRRDGDGRSRRQPGLLQQSRQVRRHRRADEPGGRENERQQPHGQAGAGRFLHRLVARRRCGLDTQRNHQPVQRQTEDDMRPGPDQAGATPAERSLQPAADRPAHGTGESGKQGNPGDRTARIAAVDAGECGERRLVKPQRHADADHQPAEPEHQRPVRKAEGRQPCREDQTGKRQHITPAVMVDALAAQRPENGRHHQRQGKCGEHGAGGQAQLARHRLGENRWQVVGRAPGQRLRAAECEHDAQARRADQRVWPAAVRCDDLERRMTAQAWFIGAPLVAPHRMAAKHTSIRSLP